MQTTTGYSARLHQGTCADLGAVAFALTGVGAATSVDGSPVRDTEPVGFTEAPQVLQSVTTLDASFSDLVEQPHALVVSESSGRTSRVIACGEIGGMLTSQMPGMVMPGDELAVGLREQEGSGYVGIALVTAEGGTASVRIYLASGLVDGGPQGTPSPND